MVKPPTDLHVTFQLKRTLKFVLLETFPGQAVSRCRNPCLPIDGVTGFRQALTRIQDTANMNFVWELPFQQSLSPGRAVRQLWHSKCFSTECVPKERADSTSRRKSLVNRIRVLRSSRPIAFSLLVYTGQPPSTRLFLKKRRTTPPLPVQSRSENALGHMATGGSRK
jgi:hypothetical protein